MSKYDTEPILSLFRNSFFIIFVKLSFLKCLILNQKNAIVFFFIHLYFFNVILLFLQRKGKLKWENYHMIKIQL